MNPRTVAIAETGHPSYPAAPFHPAEVYPERVFEGTSRCSAAGPGDVYGAVRQLLDLLGLDAARRGTPRWNPFGDFIRPGSRVLIKPNLVRHFHPYGMDPQCLVTHGSVLRALCDYALMAAGPGGEVVIADAPLQSCDFGQVLALSGVGRLVEFYRANGARVEVRDLRLVRAVADSSSRWGRVLVQESNPGDPMGYTHIDLGARSLHARREAPEDRYRVTCYDPDRMLRHHSGGRHEYVIANTLLDADVVIDVPKMKTHHKAGITGALKNFIGINGHKDCLPHHVKGTPGQGGDEYLHESLPKRIDSWIQDAKEQHGGVLVKKSAALAHKVLYAVHMRERADSFWEGSWFGNDTISRTTIDLNRIVRYADRSGTMCAAPQRTVFSVVDGVIAGDRDGPLAPRPRPSGILLGGSNPAAVDTAMCRVMGFRAEAIPTLGHAFEGSEEFPLTDFAMRDIEVVSRQARWSGIDPRVAGDSLEFEAHRGWAGRVEL
ncbi:MAG: DUF362 domain-containing protein [Bryobacteraceae bacterium]